MREMKEIGRIIFGFNKTKTRQIRTIIRNKGSKEIKIRTINITFGGNKGTNRIIERTNPRDTGILLKRRRPMDNILNPEKRATMGKSSRRRGDSIWETTKGSNIKTKINRIIR